MSVFLKVCNFEHIELSIYFNDECAIVKEAKDTNLLSKESKLTHVNLQLNIDHPCLKTDTFSMP